MEKTLEQIAINAKYTAKEFGEYINETWPITLKLRREPKKVVRVDNIPKRRGENWTLGTFRDKKPIPGKYRMAVYDFIQTLERATEDRKDLTFLLNNYNTLTINEISFQLYDLFQIVKKITRSKTTVDDQLAKANMAMYVGKYLSDENTILLSKDSNQLYTNLIHELMHMASCNFQEGKTGFCWKSDGVYVGHSLDEGINNYLSHKLFGNKGYIEDFSFETTISKLLGETAGFQKTKSAFLRGEPGEFIGELAKYYTTDNKERSSEQSIVDFIYGLDNICSSNLDINTMSLAVNKSFYVATKIFLTKQLSQYGSMNRVPDLNIDKFFKMIPNRVQINGNNIIINKNGIYNAVCSELNRYFPQAGYKIMAS